MMVLQGYPSSKMAHRHECHINLRIKSLRSYYRGTSEVRDTVNMDYEYNLCVFQVSIIKFRHEPAVTEKIRRSKLFGAYSIYFEVLVEAPAF